MSKNYLHCKWCYINYTDVITWSIFYSWSRKKLSFAAGKLLNLPRFFLEFEKIWQTYPEFSEIWENLVNLPRNIWNLGKSGKPTKKYLKFEKIRRIPVEHPWKIPLFILNGQKNQRLKSVEWEKDFLWIWDRTLSWGLVMNVSCKRNAKDCSIGLLFSVENISVSYLHCCQEWPKNR